MFNYKYLYSVEIIISLDVRRVKKLWWFVLAVVLLVVGLLWTQVINVWCDQGGNFYGGLCFINKFIPW